MSSRRQKVWLVRWERGEYTDYHENIDSVWTSKKAACRRRNEAIDEDAAEKQRLIDAGRFVPYDFDKSFWITSMFLNSTEEETVVVRSGRFKTDLQGRKEGNQ